MSGFETTDGRLDVAKMEMALQELEAGTLDPIRRDELMALLTCSPAAQLTYLQYFEISAMLGAEAATHAEQGNLPKIVGFEKSAPLLKRSLLAAALVMLGAVAAALVHVARPQVPELALTAAAGTRWSVTDEVRDIDGNTATVREGSTVRVDSGTVKLRLQSGATMVLQGPARVSFTELTRPVVESGWLWIDTGSSDEKFEVRTPDLRIRNLGTRFGVRVPAEGPAEVHLIKGKLEASPESMPGNILKLASGARGLALPALGEPVALALVRDPFPDIDRLLAAPGDYPTTVRGQSPASYWRLEGAPGGRLHNEVEGETAGRMKSGGSPGASGPGPTDGFAGFDQGNRAARLPGTSGDSLLSLGSALPRHGGLLFREAFDGSGPLHRHGPDITMGRASWVAASRFQADGKITPGMGSGTLDFQPVNGVVYTLDAAFRDVTTPAGDPYWIALGFASDQSTGTKADDRFVHGKVVGRAWMLFRGAGSELENKVHLSGTSNSETWHNWSVGVGGDIDMRIVLDTTGGSGNWTATWFARRPDGGAFVKVGATRRLPNEAIRSVGIAVSGEATRARIVDFSLRAEAMADVQSSGNRADGPLKIDLRAGAVSCWLRREPGSRRKEILWSAGEGPADDALHVRLEADGRIGFFMENGRYDVLLTSEETLADDRWHHLTASWSPYTVDLYLDGRRVAWERESRGHGPGTLPELRMGGGPQPADAAPFTGRIDEVAVWDRALTPIEIGQQYRSAREGSSKSAR